MSKPDELTQFIVCSDERALELAKALSGAGQVYGHLKSDGTWGFARFNVENAEWESVDSGSVPETFDTLFFHTGQNDPVGIPKDRTFTKEFAFSTDSVPTSPPPGNRKDAIPIQRRFPTGGCPVKKRHLRELEDYVRGARTELPAFCRRDETVPALSSLAILCQGYAAAGIAYGDIKAEDRFAIDLGWNRLQAEAISRLSGRLADLWPGMKRMDWWRASLGISDNTGKTVSAIKYQTFLARLIQDLEMDVLARNKLNLASEDDLAEQPECRLLNFLEKQPDAAGIVALLKASWAEKEIVEKAYKQVKRFLE